MKLQKDILDMINKLRGLGWGKDTLDDTIRGLIHCVEKPLKPLLYQGKMEESKSVEESKADLSESLNFRRIHNHHDRVLACRFPTSSPVRDSKKLANSRTLRTT